MEEDIKRVEKLRKELGLHADSNKIKDGIALENLIKAYKEKEYKYNKALSDLVQAEHENKELKEKIRSCEDEIQEQAKDLMFYEETIRDEYIPVSLIKEKIEELENNIKESKVDDLTYIEYCEDRISVLQELLEKRK